MDIDKKTQKSHELGLKYLQARQKEILIAKDEETRKRKVQIVLLQDENGQLKDEVAQLSERVHTLACEYDDVEAKLKNMGQKCLDQEKQLRAQVREHSTLRTELMSLSTVTQDSTKVLTEKLALSREIAVLKPEVEHLKSQLAHQKDVLAEKLELERQLNALEVELANEKRASQRAAQRQESHESEMEGELRQQVEDLEKKLAGEKRAKDAQNEANTEMQQRIRDLEAQLKRTKLAPSDQQKSQDESKAVELLKKKVEELEKALEKEKQESQHSRKDIQRELAEALGLNEIYQERVTDLKAKLKDAREELKSARADLAETKEAAARIPDVAKKLAKTAGKAQTKAQRKRLVEESSGPELLLQTPGLADEARTKRLLKKRGFDRTVGVEKSTFSITPFLNKTMGATDEAVQEAPAEEEVAAKTSGIITATETIPEEADESEVQDSIMGTSNVPAIAMPCSDDSIIEPAPPAKAAASSDAPKRRGRPPKEKVLAEKSMSKTNVQPPANVEGKNKKAAVDEAKTKTSISAADSLDEQENRPPNGTAVLKKKEKEQSASIDSAATTTTKTAKPVTEQEHKKKKRKILGNASNTIFDDDDDAGLKTDGPLVRKALTAGTAGPGMTVKRTVKALGGARPATAGVGKRTVLGGVRNAFGTTGGFSPLKRERRGVNASFLA